MSKLLVCAFKSQDFEQSQKKKMRSRMIVRPGFLETLRVVVQQHLFYYLHQLQHLHWHIETSVWIY